MASRIDTDVLIIGGGPTGLVLALELALQGIHFRIIDAAPQRVPPEQSRGLVVHARSMELLARHGITDELLSRGMKVEAVKCYTHKKLVFGFDLPELSYGDTAFPSPLEINQAETERVLDEALERNYEIKVERPLKAERVEQDDDGVTVWLSQPAGNEEEVKCKYVVGCDGSHSVVRKSAGITFNGGTYPQDFIFADVHMNWDHPASIAIFLGSGGFLTIIPMKDNCFRLITSRPEEWGKDTEPKLEHFQTAIDHFAPGKAELFDPVWIARFRLHHRIAGSYRFKRLFIAGDAAHIHSPVGGQGMNAGMQDSANLGWKLAAVLRNEKPDSFLDTYHSERHPIGMHLLNGTDKAFEFISTRSQVWLFIRNTLVSWVAPWVMNNRAARATRYRFVTQLAVRYRQSPIVASASKWTGPLKGGDRAPDGKIIGREGETNLHALLWGPGYHLLYFRSEDVDIKNKEALQIAMATLENLQKFSVSLHEISRKETKDGSYSDLDGILHDRYGFSAPGYVLIRPDQYVSFIGGIESLDELQGWT